jgi:hypothetical protein
MIIDNFDRLNAEIGPSETYLERIVDPQFVLDAWRRFMSLSVRQESRAVG